MVARVQQQVLERAKLRANRGNVAGKSVSYTAKQDNKSIGATSGLWKERQLRDYRRANNLCYFCGDKFDTDHLQKCTKRPVKPQMNALVLNDLDMQLTEETLNQLEIEDVLSQELYKLSLNAISETMSGIR